MNTDKAYAERIAADYAPKDASKVVALKKLDRRAKLPAEVFAYAFGVVAALLLGVGMRLSMGVIGAESPLAFGGGIAAGIAGIAMASANYPAYRRILSAGKRKYAADIVRLASQIAE